jgi:hypothetical protein
MRTHLPMRTVSIWRRQTQCRIVAGRTPRYSAAAVTLFSRRGGCWLVFIMIQCYGRSHLTVNIYQLLYTVSTCYKES